WGTGSESKLCTRRYGVYNISASRLEKGVDILIQKDDGSMTRQTLTETGIVEFDDIMVRAILDREHYIVGGYTLLYVYPKQ
ncbi:MAG: hypothetical protein NTU61_01540, partial [Candidatus Altiarchaeota archaeon]|nr:hypothetical protein [Candidatus Altiarchaeota archaeon]